MRTLSDTLLAAQKKADRLPYVEAKVYDFEQGIKRLHWTRLYEGSEPDNHHGIAFDGEGSMHRIRHDPGQQAAKLLGLDDHAIDGSFAGDDFVCDRFTAEASGTMAEFKVKCSGPGSVKVAIYADDNNYPGALLNAVNTPQAVIAGWNTITFPDTGITQGTVYWLASNSDSAIVGYYNAGVGAGHFRRSKLAEFDGFTFPDPANIGDYYITNYPLFKAGWQVEIPATILYRQKVLDPNPQSQFSQWTQIATDCQGPCAIAASGAKIYIFYRKTDNTIRKLYSHNYGVDWTNAELSPYADVLSLAAAWWSTSNIVVCFAAISWQLNAIVLNTDTQAASEYTHHEPANHPLLNTYGIGATYEPDHMAIIFAGKQDADPYNFYALYRTQLSSTYTWMGWEYFITSPEGAGITYEYPDCHIPSSAAGYEQVQIAAVEKFSGSAPYTLPLVCHAVRGSAFSEMAYTEPKPFLKSCHSEQSEESPYGLRLATTADYWWMERPDGVWHASRAAGDPQDLTQDILSLSQRLPSPSTGEGQGEGALVIVLDNHKGQYATPPTKRSEVVLKLGYKTTAGDEAVEVGRYWIDGWEYRITQQTQSTLTLFCLDGWGLSDKWSARYQMRWNQSTVSPKTVWEIMAALLCRWGIYLYNKGLPRSSPLDNLYPDFVVQPGTGGDTSIRSLLSFVPDGLVYEGYKAYTKDPRSDEASCYSYKFPSPSKGEGQGEGAIHAILKGEYATAVPVSRVRTLGRDASDNKLLSSAFNWDLLALAIDNFRTDYDPNLESTTRTQERADAILRTESLRAERGNLLVPANVGQELYDVITLTDVRCGISSKKYRVAAIQTNYDRSRRIYTQKLLLSAP